MLPWNWFSAASRDEQPSTPETQKPGKPIDPTAETRRLRRERYYANFGDINATIGPKTPVRPLDGQDGTPVQPKRPSGVDFDISTVPAKAVKAGNETHVHLGVVEKRKGSLDALIAEMEDAAHTKETHPAPDLSTQINDNVETSDEVLSIAEVNQTHDESPSRPITVSADDIQAQSLLSDAAMGFRASVLPIAEFNQSHNKFPAISSTGTAVPIEGDQTDVLLSDTARSSPTSEAASHCSTHSLIHRVDKLRHVKSPTPTTETADGYQIETLFFNTIVPPSVGVGVSGKTLHSLKGNFKALRSPLGRQAEAYLQDSVTEEGWTERADMLPMAVAENYQVSTNIDSGELNMEAYGADQWEGSADIPNGRKSMINPLRVGDRNRIPVRGSYKESLLSDPDDEFGYPPAPKPTNESNLLIPKKRTAGRQRNFANTTAEEQHSLYTSGHKRKRQMSEDTMIGDVVEEEADGGDTESRTQDYDSVQDESGSGASPARKRQRNADSLAPSTSTRQLPPRARKGPGEYAIRSKEDFFKLNDRKRDTGA